jgi:hypothetical protein
MMEHHAANPRLACVIQQAVLSGGDQLDLLIERWYRPFFARLPSLLPDTPAGELDGGARASVMAFNSLILGYVTLAPLHARLLDIEPLAPRVVERYVELLRSLTQ